MKLESFDIRLENAQVEALKKIARRKSFELNRNLNWCSLVRAAIDKLVKSDKNPTPTN
jgi:hypothetical protein